MNHPARGPKSALPSVPQAFPGRAMEIALRLRVILIFRGIVGSILFIPPRTMIRTLRLLLCTSVALQAENWPNWRGPAHNHSSPETGLPEKFSKTENVKWAVALPGPAA